MPDHPRASTPQSEAEQPAGSAGASQPGRTDFPADTTAPPPEPIRARLDALLEVAPDAMVVVDAAGRIAEFNARAEALFGYSGEELLGQALEVLLPERLRAAHRASLAGYLARPHSRPMDRRVTLVGRRKDGREVPVEIGLAPVETDAGRLTVAAVRDVSERVRAEQARWHDHQVLERVFFSPQFLIAYLNPDFTFVRVNPAYAAADGRPPEFFPGKSHFELYPNADNEAIFRRVVETGEAYTATAKPFEYAGHPERGVSHWDWSVHPVAGPGGAVEGLVLTLVNVTDRVRAEADRLRLAKEEAARAEAERESGFVSAVLDMEGALVVVLDAQGRIMRFNRACEQLTGYAFDEVRGRASWDVLLVPEESEPVRAEFARLQAGHVPGRHETHWRTRDGGRRRIAWENTALRDAAGAVAYVIGTGFDVTEQRRAEERLRKLSRAVEASANAIVITDTAGAIEYVNPRFTQATGYAAEEVLGRNSRLLKSGHTSPQEYARLWQTITAGGEWRGEFHNRKKNGELYWEQACISPVRDAAGAITHFVAVKEDITELKRAEAALRESEAELRALFAAMRDVILVYDAQGRYVRIAPTSPELLYRPAEELLGQTLDQVLPPQQAEAFRGYIREALATGRTVRAEYPLTIDGREVWFEAAVSPMAGDERVLWVARDITERKQAAEAVESLARFPQENPGPVLRLAGDGGLLYANPASVSLLEAWGYWEGRPLPETPRETLEAALRDGVPHEAEAVVGTRVYWLIFAPVVEAGYVNVYARDITERRQAEAALRLSEERLAVTLRSIGDGVIASDTDGRITLMNPVAEALTGWPQAEATGRPVAEVFRVLHEHSRAPAEDPVRQVLHTGGVVGLANHTVLIARDGAERAIADSGAPIRTPDGRVLGVVLVFRDVTDTRRLEEELRRADKLDALGVLAGGIAHDFNNILTAILANTSLARMATPPEAKTSQWLAEVERASRRAKDLTQQLLTFAKGGTPVRRLAALDELLRDSATFALRGSNAQPEFAFAGDLWPAEVDEGQISQVIHNLVLNAQQAMPGGGTVYIAAENVEPGGEAGLPLAAGRFVRVTVADRGPGIPTEVLPRIFDPFFTTKRSGTGLGLATTHSIVERHGGHVTVDSTPGAGTTFSVYLPAAEGARPVAAEAGEAVRRGRGRILAMDDEAALRELLSEALSMLGYDVALVTDGAQAVGAYRQARDSGHPFDAVILDLTAPGGMGGLEALRCLRELDPRVRAIASSGYSTDPIMADFRGHGFHGAVAKPYTVGELSRVVSEVLAAEA